MRIYENQGIERVQILGPVVGDGEFSRVGEGKRIRHELLGLSSQRRDKVEPVRREGLARGGR